MASTTPDAVIRAQLHQDLIAIWNPTKIHDYRAMIPNDIKDLPLAFIELPKLEVTRGGGTAGMGEDSTMYEYSLTGMFKWPDPRTITIEQDQDAKVQALITQLKARTRYSANDYHRYLKGWDIEDAFTEQTKEHIYTITVIFAIEVVSSA